MCLKLIYLEKKPHLFAYISILFIVQMHIPFGHSGYAQCMPKDNLHEFVLSFHSVGSENSTETAL